jgi:hypothetical protein
LNNETDKPAKSVASVRNDTQQQILSVNEKFVTLGESVNEKSKSMNDKFDRVNDSVQERSREHISETKRNQVKLSKYLEVTTKDILPTELFYI